MIVEKSENTFVLSLKSGNAKRRAHAACVLGLMGPAARGAAPALAEALDDEDPTVRRHAALALGRIGAAEDLGPAFIGGL